MKQIVGFLSPLYLTSHFLPPPLTLHVCDWFCGFLPTDRQPPLKPPALSTFILILLLAQAEYGDKSALSGTVITLCSSLFQLTFSFF